jgi:hypothetical protein
VELTVVLTWFIRRQVVAPRRNNASVKYLIDAARERQRETH